MSAFVDRASSGRTLCVVCGQAVAKATARVIHETAALRRGEGYTQRTYYHLGCAIELQRGLALEALGARATSTALVADVLAEVERLDASLAGEVRARREAHDAPTRRARPLDDRRTGELLAELEASPGDRGILAVLGDHLQALGDERGELIVLDLAASTDPEALSRRRALTAALAPAFGGDGRVGWGVGFLRKVELSLTPASRANVAAQLAHPSCRLLEVVEINRVFRGVEVALPTGFLLRSVRTLYLRGGLGATSDLASLPHLAHLDLDDAGSFASASLVSLTISEGVKPETVAALDAARLPRLRRLTIERCRTIAPTAGFVGSGLLGQLTEVALADVRFDGLDVAALELALAGRRLARLSIARVTTSFTGPERARLAALCDVLELPGVAPGVDPDDGFVEHTGKPEWGRGKIIRAYDGKLEIEFPSGKRTLRADAPFLRRGR